MFEKLLDNRIQDLWNFYLTTGAVMHPGEKGSLRESFVKKLLASVLPPHYGIGSGIIVDRWDRCSRQADIIIYDRRLMPPFLEEDGHGIYPIDAVLRVIEVKSTLDKPGMEQFRDSAWRLSPDNPDGLRVAQSGTLVGGQTLYPLFGLFAYDTAYQDTASAFRGVSDFGFNQGMICCIATKGVFRCWDFMEVVQGGSDGQVILNCRIFVTFMLSLIEQASASRSPFQMSEWIFHPGQVPETNPNALPQTVNSRAPRSRSSISAGNL